jgi:predicted PurR-regulated permease PerM
MNLSTRLFIFGVVACVAWFSIFDQEIIPTLIGIVIIALLRPFVEKLYERVRKDHF